MSVAFGTFGLAVKDTRNISISDTEIVFTSSGIHLYSTIVANICNVVVKLSRVYGIVIESSQYTSISNTVVMNSQKSGVLLMTSVNADIVNTSVSHSGLWGLHLVLVDHITLTSTSVTKSLEGGIAVFSSSYATFFNISVMYSGVRNFIGETHDLLVNNSYNTIDQHGLLLDAVDNAILCNVRVKHSRVGIGTFACFNITIKNTTVAHVSGGITLVNGSNICISHTALNISSLRCMHFEMRTLSLLLLQLC